MNNQHKPRLFFVQCQKSVWPIHMLWETIKHKTLSKWHVGFPKHFLSCESIENWCCCTNFHFHRQPAKECMKNQHLWRFCAVSKTEVTMLWEAIAPCPIVMLVPQGNENEINPLRIVVSAPIFTFTENQLNVWKMNKNHGFYCVQCQKND